MPCVADIQACAGCGVVTRAAMRPLRLRAKVVVVEKVMVPMLLRQIFLAVA